MNMYMICAHIDHMHNCNMYLCLYMYINVQMYYVYV